MATASASGAHDLTPPVRGLPARLMNWFFLMVVVAFLAVGYKNAHINDLHMLVDHSANTGTYLKDYLHPNFKDWKLYVDNMWLTVQMAMWGTFLSVILAVPLSLLCSNNIAPQWVVQPMRGIMNILRAFPELVLGIAFTVAVGLGPLAGVLALTLNNTGTLAKLFSEAVEAIEIAPVEGVRATGGNRFHEIIWGVLPQVAPLWTSFALYRFESNSRSATVLGLIGAGGIGQILFENLNAFDYARTSAIAVVIVIAVTLIDLLSQQLRKYLL